MPAAAVPVELRPGPFAGFDPAWLDSVPTAIFVHDAEGKPYFANRQARALFEAGPDLAVAQVAAGTQIYVADTDTCYPLEQLSSAVADEIGVGGQDTMEIRRISGTVHLEVWVKTTLAADGSVAWVVHSFVDVSDRKNLHADLVLNESLGKAVTTAPGFADVLETSLREICQLTGWTFGQAWLPDAGGAHLRCRFAWHESSIGFSDFHQACQGIKVNAGSGLPGRAWQSKKWQWSDDDATLADDDLDDPCRDLLTGHRARVAMPVLVEDEVVAVLEFLVLVGGSQDQRSVDRVASVVARVGLWMSTKGAEDAGHRGEEKFRQIAEATTDAILFADADTRILYLNPAAEALFGYTEPEVTGRLMADLLCERHRSLRERSTNASLQLPQDIVAGPPLLLTARCQDGTQIPIEATLASWQDGGETFYTAVVRDSSDRVRTERTQYTVLQTVAHDLRSPIAAVLILTGILSADAEQPDPKVRVALLPDIERSMRKMSRVLQDLLDSDPEQPMRARRRRCDVGELVKRVVAENDVTISHPVHCDLASVHINVDAAQIERVVENLLNNAVKYVGDGIPVWVSTSPHEKGALITVADAGAGVSADMTESIFEPFRRGGDPESLSLGLGLGLSLVARFAQLNGGRAWVEPRAGGGASFQVYLPDNEDCPQ